MLVWERMPTREVKAKRSPGLSKERRRAEPASEVVPSNETEGELTVGRC